MILCILSYMWLLPKTYGYYSVHVVITPGMWLFLWLLPDRRNVMRQVSRGM